jgi:hypothetical protein
MFHLLWPPYTPSWRQKKLHTVRCFLDLFSHCVVSGILVFTIGARPILSQASWHFLCFSLTWYLACLLNVSSWNHLYFLKITSQAPYSCGTGETYSSTRRTASPLFFGATCKSLETNPSICVFFCFVISLS